MYLFLLIFYTFNYFSKYFGAEKVVSNVNKEEGHMLYFSLMNFILQNFNFNSYKASLEKRPIYGMLYWTRSLMCAASDVHVFSQRGRGILDDNFFHQRGGRE